MRRPLILTPLVVTVRHDRLRPPRGAAVIGRENSLSRFRSGCHTVNRNQRYWRGSGHFRRSLALDSPSGAGLNSMVSTIAVNRICLRGLSHFFDLRFEAVRNGQAAGAAAHGGCPPRPPAGANVGLCPGLVVWRDLVVNSRCAGHGELGRNARCGSPALRSRPSAVPCRIGQCARSDNLPIRARCGVNIAEVRCPAEDWCTNTAHFLPCSTELPR
jgi:hypothetical protein